MSLRQFKVGLVVLVSLLFVLLGCNSKGGEGNGTNGEIPKIISAPVVEEEVVQVDSLEEELLNVTNLEPPSTLEERFSYTYGYLLMEGEMREFQEGLLPAYFARGALDAGFGNPALLDKGSMNNALYEYQRKIIEEATKRLEELASKNLEDAESFLAINGKREGVITTSTGLQYEVVKDSEGDKPLEDETVRVNYRLTYLDGREGDASIRGIPSTFDLSHMISGFREGLLLMGVGSEFRFFVHPNLGYGVSGSAKIEPNTLLIFDVELVEIID
jgi:FKBP-type peptidyl-prolyl cis-trans isomerase